MTTRYLLKNVAIATVAVCVMTLGLASWPTVRGTAWAQEGQSTINELAITATSQSSRNRTNATSIQIAATSQGNEQRIAGQVAASGQSNEKRIASALKSKGDFQYADTTLAEVFSSIAQTHAIPVVIDSAGLAAEGVTTDTPVSLQVSGIQLENALKLVLRPHRLTAVVSEEVLLVTAEQSADKYTTSTKIYPFENSAIKLDQLAALVQSKIEPDSWKEVGGIGSVDTVRGALVVRNAARVHDDIADFLSVLEKIGK